jgi:hypothetical protein
MAEVLAMLEPLLNIAAGTEIEIIDGDLDLVDRIDMEMGEIGAEFSGLATLREALMRGDILAAWRKREAEAKILSNHAAFKVVR